MAIVRPGMGRRLFWLVVVIAALVLGYLFIDVQS